MTAFAEHRNTSSIVRLCCLAWPRCRRELPLLYKWAPPKKCCGVVAGSVLLGTAIFPWAVLKGAFVAVPAAMFGFVGGVLLIPTSLARTIICLAIRALFSRTMSCQVSAAHLHAHLLDLERQGMLPLLTF